jgi:hypothetical protein
MRKQSDATLNRDRSRDLELFLPAWTSCCSNQEHGFHWLSDIDSRYPWVPLDKIFRIHKILPKATKNKDIVLLSREIN